MGAIWFDDDLYFSSGPGARKSRNLAANPACTISVQLAGIDLTLTGEANRVPGRLTQLRSGGGERRGLPDDAFGLIGRLPTQTAAWHEVPSTGVVCGGY